MPDRELEQCEQIVFFVDVLGSSAVVLGSDSQRIEALTKMLRDVSSHMNWNEPLRITRELRHHASFIRKETLIRSLLITTE